MAALVSVLVTGASGGLGRYVVRALRKEGVEVLAPEHGELSILNEGDVCDYFDRHRPARLVHLAAQTNVGYCAEHPDAAVLCNAVGTRHVMHAASRYCRQIVYMSTDAVLAGWMRTTSAGEISPSLPPFGHHGAYAWSKYVGEEVALVVGGRVVRANFFTRYCRSKQSFVDYAFSAAKEQRPFYRNVVSTPVHASTLADRIAKEALGQERGVLHVCSSDAVNRADQARRILRAYGLPTNGVEECDAPEPYDGRLTSVRGGVVGTVDDEIAKLVKEEPLK